MRTVLVIDPDQHFRDYVKLALERAGHAAHALSNGAALATLLRDLVIDAVICDIYPGDESAVEMLRTLRRLAPALPVVAMSGSGFDGEHPRWSPLLRTGGIEVLAKPARPHDILAALERAIARAG